MKNLVDLVIDSGSRAVAVVGTSKNAGKTVTMTYLASNLAARGYTVGLVSSGRDGETVDAFTGEPKPSVVPPVGSLVATAEGVLGDSGVGLEMLDVTERAGLFGRLVVAQVVDPVPIELVGPQSAGEIAWLVRMLLSYGADIVLVDGALDRIAAANPHVTDASILCTGSFSGESLRAIANQVQDLVWLWNRPVPEELELVRLGKAAVELRRVTVLGSGNMVEATPFTRCLGHEEEILALCSERKAVAFPGALTRSFLRDIRSWTSDRNFSVIARDPTAVFYTQDPGVRLLVQTPIKLLGITVNPTSWKGLSYDPIEMVGAVAAAARRGAGKSVPVFDVVSQEAEFGGEVAMAMG